jgi:GNAT superfamily N-acetyltransferase
MSGGTTGGPADPTRPPSGALALPDLPSGLAHAHARRVTDDDAEGVIALIGAAYAEHPGCVLDLPGVDADLVAPATHAHARAADWWVVVDPSLPDPIVASVAHGQVTLEGDLELKRLYVAATHRRQGLAGALTVSDAEVAEAVRFAFRHLKLVVEPGGAVSLAALLAGKVEGAGRTTGLILSGGNVDPGLYAVISEGRFEG